MAIPSATHAEQEILNRLEHLPVHVKTVPDLFDMVSGKVGVDEIRDIDIEDLLGRDIVPPDPQLRCLHNRSGGNGDRCRWFYRRRAVSSIVTINPSRLIILDAFEYGLYAIEAELREKLKSIEGGEHFGFLARNAHGKCHQNLQSGNRLSCGSL